MPEQTFINTDIFSIRQFSLRRKNPDSFPRPYTAFLFSCIRFLQKQESKAVPVRIFLTKHLSGNQNR